MSPAPIVLFVYNRPVHTRLTVEALARNELAARSDLIVYADGARSAEQERGVAEVRDYLGRIAGFASVTVVARERNLGLAGSVIAGVSEQLARNETLVVLEDDMVTSPFFLRFMNDALERYRHDERVVSVHGYIYPVPGRLPETFFLRDTGCWGWATWRRGWRLFNPDAAGLLAEIGRRRAAFEFDLDGSYGFTKMLRRQAQGLSDSWAIRWQASAFLQGKLTLFPGVSLVNNIGHDDSGVHSTGTGSFAVALADAPVAVAAIPVEESRPARRQLRDYFLSLYGTAPERWAHRALANLRAMTRKRA